MLSHANELTGIMHRADSRYLMGFCSKVNTNIELTNTESLTFGKYSVRFP